MFGGTDYLTRGLTRRSGLPAMTWAQMEALQARIEDGEECYPPGGIRTDSKRPLVSAHART